MEVVLLIELGDSDRGAEQEQVLESDQGIPVVGCSNGRIGHFECNGRPANVILLKRTQRLFALSKVIYLSDPLCAFLL